MHGTARLPSGQIGRRETRVACLGNPDPVGMKVYAPVGEKTFDDIQTMEEAHAGADRREAACRGRDAECRQGSGSGAAVSGDQRGDVGSLAGRAPPRSGGRGGMKSEEAKRLKALEDENSRLKQLVADQALDIQMLKHLSEGNW